MRSVPSIVYLLPF